MLDINKYFAKSNENKDINSDFSSQKKDNIDIDSTNTTIYTDSILDANIDTSGLINNDEDIVISDKMLLYKNIKVKGLDEIGSNKLALLDSLLMNDTERKTDQLMVEFWESPLNYKGYKLSDNKLILFGIKEFEFASIEINNKKLYLRYLDNLYPLEYSTDYKALVIADLK